jgi:hypothetical protein
MRAGAALEGEIIDRLGYEKHDPAGPAAATRNDV